MNIIPIVFAFDNNLIMPACVCISSLLSNAKSDTFYDIFIIHSHSVELNHEEIDKLPIVYANCRIQYRTIDNMFDSAFEIRGISTPAYYRLMIPELIPEYKKVLYSDVDVIFREDLSDFYDIDMGDCYFGAVDVGVALRPEICEYVEQVLKLDSKNGFFYSGNLIINSEQIIKDGLLPRFRALSQNQYKFQDMDIINIACNGRIKPLSPSFCLTNYLYYLIINRSDEYSQYVSLEEQKHALDKGIVHYNGDKPWNKLCLNQDIWWHYYRRSPQYDESYCAEYYKNVLGIADSWSFVKRIKHVVKYFVR